MQNAEVLNDLLRRGSADEHARHPRAFQHPTQRELREALPARARNLVERCNLGKLFLRELLPL